MKRTHWYTLVALLSGSCGSANPAPPSAPPPRVTHAHMRKHFDVANDIQRAVVDGRLSDARDLASWLATHNDELDPPAPIELELQTAAASIAESLDLLSAGGAVARLGRACARCHEETHANVSLGFARFSAPPEMPTLQGQMARHAWAAERLWHGVIGPSDSAWSEGARVMGATSIDVSRTTNAKPNLEVAELADKMRELSNAAERVTDNAVRATMYGEMLVTCARCHSIVRIHPVADR
jgi:hypothetical protein